MPTLITLSTWSGFFKEHMRLGGKRDWGGGAGGKGVGVDLINSIFLYKIDNKYKHSNKTMKWCNIAMTGVGSVMESLLSGYLVSIL